MFCKPLNAALKLIVSVRARFWPFWVIEVAPTTHWLFWSVLDEPRSMEVEPEPLSVARETVLVESV